MKKIAIMGAGGFGTALAFVLSRNSQSVSLWDQDEALIAKWRKQNFSDRYPYLKKHKFNKNIKLISGSVNADDHDYVIVSTSTSGITGALNSLNTNGKTPIVLIQKGMLDGLISPHDLAKKIFPKETIMQFTGAGFAKDLVGRSPAGMIVLHETKDTSTASDFASVFKGSNIWPTLCSDLFGVNIHNSLRTIASFEQGFVYGYFEHKFRKKPPVSTIAITFSAINQETKLIARNLGATKEIHDIESKVHRILEADLMLCQSDSSRNFALGHFVGKGYCLDEAKKKVTEGVAECLNNISSIFAAISEKVIKDTIEDSFPYLLAAKNLTEKGEIESQMKRILSHHENYIA
ncbi:MAG: Glycerol-3-phosphate dehydrogenase (NAD(P)+) [bacterium ADurb.Bin212]|nr:MAG: Glycerol-3-phosphate dehydrogenase (NAD(P)+) [bacterium ADurb.Bin212]